MDSKLMEIAERIRGLREILEFSEEEVAAFTDVTLEEYRMLEAGKSDFTFTFLFKCAEKFGVDMVELLTGDRPKLSFYSVVRAGKGFPIKRRQGFEYQHLGYLFRNKLAEPFLVKAPYIEAEQNEPIHLSYHEGQEFDFILQGSLKVAMEDHVEVLHAGDTIYYDSGHGHGMIATGGEECIFLAVVLKKPAHQECE